MEKKVISTNRKAFHDFHIFDKFIAGLVLTGTEIKSIRSGKVNLKDSYASIEKGEVYIHSMHISPYEHGNIFNKDPLRPRRLLLHKKEIMKLIGKTQEIGVSLIPLSVYFLGSKVKIELGLARGKKAYDKRAAIAEKDAKRNIDRALKDRMR